MTTQRNPSPDPLKDGLARFREIVGDIGPVNMTPRTKPPDARRPAEAADFESLEAFLQGPPPSGQ